MFDNLSDKLQRVFKNLRGEGKLTAENMEAALREIRVALLEADVHFRVVKQFIENIKVKAMGEEVLSALSPAQQVVKIVRDELIKTLGSHQSKLRMANEPPSAIMIVGLQGSGKTTTTGKLARWLSKNGQPIDGFRGHLPPRSPPTIECDRPRYQIADLRRYTGGNQARRARPWSSPRLRPNRPRRAVGGHRRPPAHRRSTDGRAAGTERATRAFGSPVRSRRHDWPGRGEIGRRVP